MPFKKIVGITGDEIIDYALSDLGLMGYFLMSKKSIFRFKLSVLTELIVPQLNSSMATIKIISATPGLNTQETLSQIIQERQTGITIKEMSQKTNRPVSMLQICLKQLVSAKKVCARKSKVNGNLIYYPLSN